VGAGSSSTLVAARCLSGTSCYADGFSYGRNAFSVFLEHWDGRSWSSSDAPPGGAPAAGVSDLACTASGFCVVPLQTGRISAYAVTAGTWSPMLSDDPSSAVLPDATINSVDCISPGQCVAAGGVGDSSGSQGASLGLVWNGAHWSSTVLPAQGADPIQTLLSMSCTSSSFCIAVGHTNRTLQDRATGHSAIAVRWNGSTWAPLAVPEGTRLDDVSCVSSSSCFAAGADGTLGLLLHWDGRTWVKEPSPPARPYLALSCTSTEQCLALPQPDATHPLGTLPLALRWHGTWFTLTGYPAPAAYLSGVSCQSNGCLVVGQSRARPSVGPNDVARATSSAAFYDFTGGSATPPPATPTRTTTAGDITGLWYGNVTQHGPGTTTQHYFVEMTVTAGTVGSVAGEITYPSLNCGGTLQLLSIHGSSYVYREQINVGRSRCSSGGTIDATVTGASLSWRWTAPGIEVVGVFGHPQTPGG
jgi:hypothetical protein